MLFFIFCIRLCTHCTLSIWYPFVESMRSRDAVASCIPNRLLFFLNTSGNPVRAHFPRCDWKRCQAFFMDILTSIFLIFAPCRTFSQYACGRSPHPRQFRFERFSECVHLQLVVFPFSKLLEHTVASLPQSHLHNQLALVFGVPFFFAPFCLIPARFMTVNFPYL